MKSRVLLFTSLVILVAHPAKAQREVEWTWRDSSGKCHARAELQRIVQEHLGWVESRGAVGRRMDMTGSNLFGAFLNGACGSEADLIYARRSGAELRNAILENARLSKADLSDLSDADLSGASLALADLSGTELVVANLDHADLRWTNLAGANLDRANLTGAVFEPQSIPEVSGIAAAQNLELMTYHENPGALVELRKQFVDRGFREQERKITYALKRREAERSWVGCWRQEQGNLWSSDSNLANCGSFALNRMFFDWTCQYGMSPGRPLGLGVSLWLLCSVLYFVRIHVARSAEFYRVYIPILQANSSVPPRIDEILPGDSNTRGGRWSFEFLQREWLVFRASMFFSLMSAFNIGFRDINFGRWLRLLTRQEFDIKALGWARVIAGWQSLISVFLIALFILTFFGRPFG